jgi:hypothetical protein
MFCHFWLAVSLSFAYVGAQFMKEDKQKKNQKNFHFHLVKRRIPL